jgi:hypothetical protein
MEKTKTKGPEAVKRDAKSGKKRANARAEPLSKKELHKVAKAAARARWAER